MPTDFEKELNRVIEADHHDPFLVLGLHDVDKEHSTAAIRTFQPHADSVMLVVGDEKSEMNRIKKEGVFEIRISDYSDTKPYLYQFEASYYGSLTRTFYDPYSFLPQLTEFDQHLFKMGTHYEFYEKMGAHCTEIENIPGTMFRVWAPTARRVSVIGDFNFWDGRVHQMRVIRDSGIWELFIPGIEQGEIYKFEIRSGASYVLEKADPYQFHAEFRPKSASIVWDIGGYEWQDKNWLDNRKNNNPYENPLSIYEIHPGSWRRDPEDPTRFLTFEELGDHLIPYLKEMNFTHVELMPVMEHPLDESWGYQVTGYFAVTSRFGTPQDFMRFVDRCHQNNIGVILDWVPSHFPTDGHSLGRFDGTALYEHDNPMEGEHPEWETLIFNFGRKEVSNFLMSNALFWFDKFHIDGLRWDAVASMLYRDYAREDGKWVPNRQGGNENLEAIEFIKHLNSIAYDRFPDIMMIAEESTSFFGVSKPADAGGLGFGFKWNMGWMNDMLRYFTKDPIYRKHHHNALTFSLLYAFSENFILPLSHDEVVHGKNSLLSKMPGDRWQQFANLRLLFLLQFTHPGKKLLFMGGEFGQISEWYCKVSIDWHLVEEDGKHQQMQQYVKHLNKLYLINPALWEVDFSDKGFKWIDFKDVDNSIIVFARFAKNPEDHLVCLLNFTPQVLHAYKMGVPSNVKYMEIFSSDAAKFGGSEVGNTHIKEPIKEALGEAPYHVLVSVPPLGGIILKPVPEEG